MMPSVLTPAQIDEFIETGVAVLRGGFSPEVAEQCRTRIWTAVGMNPDARSTWTKPLIHVQQCPDDGPFATIHNPRLDGAIDDLLGAGRYDPVVGFGWWPIAFPGFDMPPWRLPDSGWHIDGTNFRHHVDSSNQGLLSLFIFSEIQPGDGGTAYVPGSHAATARILLESEPLGLEHEELTRRVTCQVDKSRGIEATGMPGDVFLLHPFMLHARSPNTGSRVRFICNPCMSLRERPRLDPHPDRTPLERSIMLALESSAS
jgi:hypothetical protein